MITDEQLNERENWENCAANSFDVPDGFVLELIREVRDLRGQKGHSFINEPECVFCGCFGPTEEDEDCVSRAQIGRQVGFLRDKLLKIVKVCEDMKPRSEGMTTMAMKKEIVGIVKERMPK